MLSTTNLAFGLLFNNSVSSMIVRSKQLAEALPSADINYWRQQLTGIRVPLELPVDCARLSPAAPVFARHSLSLAPALTTALVALSDRAQTTLFVTLLTAFKVLLYRYTSQEDIWIASPVALSQESANAANTSLVNTTVLRSCIEGSLAFDALLKQVAEIAAVAQTHGSVPFSALTQNPDAVCSQQALLQTVFALYDAPLLTPASLPLSRVLVVEHMQPTAETALAVHLTHTDSGLSGWIEYAPEQFTAETMTRLVGHYQSLLSAVAADASQPVRLLPLLSAAEQQQLIDWNCTAAPLPEICMHRLIEAQAERTPEAIAVVCGDQQLSYQAFNQQANQLAHYLRSLGVRSGDLVAISAERSPALLVAFLAVLKTGAAYVPLDPAYPHARRAYKLKDAQVSIVLSEAALLPDLPKSDAQVVLLDQDWSKIAQYSQQNLPELATPDHLAYVIYTSGSTGNPKGVTISHRSMVNHSLAIAKAYAISSQDRVLQFSSMSFDIIIEELFPSWISGAAVVLRRQEHISANRLLAFVAAEQITVLNLPTAFWHQLVGSSVLAQKAMPSCVRLVVVGGEKASRSLYLKWHQQVGTYPRWLNAYGPTETTVTATLYDPAASPATLTSRRNELPIGKPLDNLVLHVLDANLQPVPIGVAGELYIGGAGLSSGYLNRPDLTESRFIANPISPERSDYLYKTGDLVRYLADGNVEFIGRADFQVKIRGFRIELGEIEAVLEKHPQVQQSVVLAQPDSAGEKRLVAYLLADPAEPLEMEQLRDFVALRLPDYMVPFAFVTLESLPLTPNGKVDRRALPPLSEIAPATARQIVPPRDELEQQLVTLWQEVLGVEAVGITDNFFELGGHSLLAAMLTDQIEQSFNRALPLSTVFQSPTIEQLAAELRQPEAKGCFAVLANIQPQGNQPPLFLCEGVSIYRSLVPYLGLDQPIYGLITSSPEQAVAPEALIEHLATQYVEKILAVQPQGPYYLGGLSFGGIVAFEIAQKLQALGQPVALVALLDSALPHYAFQPFPLGQRLQYHLQKLAQEGVGHIYNRLKSKLTRAYGCLLTSRQQTIPHALEYLVRQEVYDEAEKYYQPQPYSGKVAVFKAKIQEEAAIVSPDLGWRFFASPNLETYEVEGDHLGILEEPKVRDLGTQLKQCLDAVRAAEATAVAQPAAKTNPCVA